MKQKIKKINDLLTKMESFLLGSHACICCKKECDSNNEYRLCLDCMKSIPFTGSKYCLRCGEIIKGEYDFCIRCKDKTYDFDYSRSVFAYTDKTSNMIMNFKYNGCKDYVKPLGKLLKDFFVTSDLIADTVTYVPMPAKREKERGYNQSYELANEFSKLTEIPLIHALVRTKENIKQATLNAEERRKNIKGSFKVIDKSLVKGKEILIIDDVMTTGSTTSECAKMLMNAGAKNVQVLTLAKTIAGSVDNLIDVK